MKLNRGIIAIIFIILLSVPCAQAVNVPSKSRNSNLTSSERAQVQSSPTNPWSMFQHDLNHTGRSEYSTSTNNGKEKWEFIKVPHGGLAYLMRPAIDSNGTIYFGVDKLYALYPNGTIKWSLAPRPGLICFDTPALGSNGVIYVQCGGNWSELYAVYPNGTKKWDTVIPTPGTSSASAPSVVRASSICAGQDIIYLTDWATKLFAIWGNGTIKWNFTASNVMESSPAVDYTGTIYVGDGYYLYAISPNGKEKWNYTTGSGSQVSPSIGSDGTIYYVGGTGLIALYPNGTKKWEYPVGIGSDSFAIGSDGTIYFGSGYYLYAISPGGKLKWKFPCPISESSPAIGSDGTIYIGSYIFGSKDDKVYAIYPNGTEKWEFPLGKGTTSSPAIGSDGTIYIGSPYEYKLYAIGYMPVPEFTTTIVFVSLSFIAMFILVRSRKRE